MKAATAADRPVVMAALSSNQAKRITKKAMDTFWD